jgi:hypothetical protein
VREIHGHCEQIVNDIERWRSRSCNWINNTIRETVSHRDYISWFFVACLIEVRSIDHTLCRWRMKNFEICIWCVKIGCSLRCHKKIIFINKDSDWLRITCH